MEKVTTSPVVKKKARFYYGYVIVGLASFVLLVVSGTMYTYGVFLKPLAADFNIGRAETSGVYSMSLFIAGFLYMFSGRLTDRFGPRVVLTVSGVFLGAGYFLMSRITAVWQLYLVFGVVIAIGQSGGLVPMLSMVARWFVKRRGIMSGIVVAGTGMGQVIIPQVATYLIGRFDWRTTFAIVGVAIFVLLVTVAQFLRRDPAQVGQVAYGAEETAPGSPAKKMSGFSRGEALRTRQLWMLYGIYVCHGFYMQATMIHIVPYATDVGISPTTAATILAAIGGLGVVARIMMGSISDRFGIKRTLVIGFGLALAGMVWLQFTRQLWTFYVFAFLFSLAYAALVAMEAPVTAESFGLKSHGEILAIVHLGSTTGGAISPILTGLIFDMTHSYNLAFLLFACFSAAGLVLISVFRAPHGTKAA
ncbi:MAG: MFS transporter [Dehalococcoidales bacterium]|nr:MFS transporter [Dehalococcoidales bacterium]